MAILYLLIFADIGNLLGKCVRTIPTLIHGSLMFIPVIPVSSGAFLFSVNKRVPGHQEPLFQFSNPNPSDF